MTYTLVEYGSNCLQNSRFAINAEDARNFASLDIQLLQAARANGSVITNSRREARIIKLDGRITVPEGSNLQDVSKDLTRILDYQKTTLRFIPEWTLINDFSSLTGVTGYQDAVNLSVNTSEYQINASSLEFDIDVSADATNYATINYDPVTAIDLSAYNETDAIEYYLYIPNATYVTTTTLRFGSSFGVNEYQGAISTDYQGNPLQEGWNKISFLISAMTKTGTPDLSAIDFVNIALDYTVDQQDMAGVKISGLIATKESRVRNYRAVRAGVVPVEGNHYNNQFAKFSVEFNNYTGYAESTFQHTALSSTTITGSSLSTSLEFDGGIPPLPMFNITVATATGIASISIQQQQTNESVQFARTWTSGDAVIFGGLTYESRVNSSDLDFDGVIPTFKLGSNRVAINIASTAPTTVSQTTFNADRLPAINNNDSRLAQSFTSTVTGQLTRYVFQVWKQLIFGVYGIVNWEVRADSGGNPTGSVLASGSYDMLSTSENINVTGLNVTVTSGTKYWFVIKNKYLNGAFGETNFNWGYNTAGGYAGGEAKSSTNNGVTWSAALTGDQVFTAYLQGAAAWGVTVSSTYKKLY